jgi:hypothetical protein
MPEARHSMLLSDARLQPSRERGNFRNLPVALTRGRAANPEHVFPAPAPARRRPHHEAKNEPLPKTPESAKPGQGASVQAPKKPPGVAGF